VVHYSNKTGTYCNICPYPYREGITGRRGTAPCYGHLIHWEKVQYPLHTRLSWLQSQPGHLGKQKFLVVLSGSKQNYYINIYLLQPLGALYTPVILSPTAGISAPYSHECSSGNYRFKTPPSSAGVVV